MLGGVIAVVITVLFYRYALTRGLPAVQWGVAGLIAFYVPNFVWSLMVAKPMLATLHNQNAPMKASLVGHSSILVGAVCAWLVWLFFLRKSIESDNG